MNRTKIQQLLNKLDGKNEATAKVIADFDVSVKALRDKLEKDITVATLDEVNLKINRLKKLMNVEELVSKVEEIRTNFKENALATLKQIEDRVSELRTVDRDLEEKTNIIAKNIVEVNNTLTKSNTTVTEQIKEVVQAISKVEGKLPFFADKKIIEEQLQTLIEKDNTEELKDYTDRTRIELLNLLAQRGGGNANRNIAIGGNNSVLSKYTDINLKAGSNTTITYATNNTTKQVDITFASSGGGGSVVGTVRQIQTISTTTTIGTLSGTDQVYLCDQGIQVVLPTPVSDTNLYTIKNISNSSILIVGTIDNDASGIIMPLKYTSVDIISNNIDWNIT